MSADKDPLAVELGRRGGLKGGKARAASMTPEERSAAARHAARRRWGTAEPAVEKNGRITYPWNYYRGGRRVDGKDAGTQRTATFRLSTARTAWACASCGTLIPIGTTHYKTADGIIRLCRGCVPSWRAI